jgi:diguanylate cyclase (GGDEF)-like protein/PAS domain S-box-containing protein
VAWRFPLAARLTVTLTGVAMLTLASAAFMQDRALSHGLRAAAEERLNRSALAAERLAADHLRERLGRYAAIYRMPERTGLELGDAATRSSLARSLARQFGATQVELADGDGTVLAQFGSGKRGGSLVAAWQSLRKDPKREAACVGLDESKPDFAPCGSGREPRLEATIQQNDGAAQVLARVPISTGALLIGAPLASAVLDGWSELTGARVTAADPSSPSEDPLAQVAHAFPGLELRVSSALAGELATLAATRRHGSLAGLVALLIALYISSWSARDFLRPIKKIQWATEQVGRGDLEVRLRSTRADEIGDVARVLDQTLDRLSSSQQRLRNVQHIAHFGDWSADPERDVVEGSPEFQKVVGLHAAGGWTVADFLHCFVGADRDKLEDRLTKCFRNGTPIEIDLRVAARPRERIVHMRAERIADGDGTRIEGSVLDITDRRRAEEQIRTLAYHDSLTGLPNRRFMNERLALALAPQQRQDFSLLFVDLDRFKLVNDTLGHSAGDELVREVANRLTRIVGGDPNAAVARFGGDEFALFLPGLSEETEITAVVSDLIRAVSAPVVLQGQEMSITASVGVSRSPADGETIEAVLRSCDTALHRAKENGRNCFCLYDATMEEEANQRWRLENRLRRAVEAMAFEVHYQPRVRASDGSLVSFEALLRWEDADFGGYKPAEFIPIAEEIGLIVPLGVWVLRTVLQQLRLWRDERLPIACVSINVSGRQLTRELADVVRDLLNETGVDPSHLEIEVTESAVIADAEAGIAALAELRKLGVRLSLDDFGTGYSSLSYLRTLPITGVKIDRSFATALGESGRDAELVASIVGMAKVLGLSVIAEGVETEEQAELLAEMGCDELQGFLFGGGVSSAEARRLLVERPLPVRAKPNVHASR